MSHKNRLCQDLKPMHPTGVEPVTFASGGQRSIQLSYGCAIKILGRAGCWVNVAKRSLARVDFLGQ